MKFEAGSALDKQKHSLPDNIMVVREKKRLKGISSGCLEMLHNCLPISTKVVIYVAIPRLPHEHINSIARLRKAK